MKKLLLISLSLVSVSAWSQGTILNADFENWTEVTSSVELQDWFTNSAQNAEAAFRTTDAIDQTYAVHLESVDDGQGGTTAGQLAYGTFTPSFYAAEYTAAVDSFVCYLKFDFALNDTGSVAVFQSVQGNNVPTAFQVFGSSNNQFLRLAVPMASPTQDSIQILFTTENLFGNFDPVPGSFMIVDSAHFVVGSQAAAALPNASFEGWDEETYLDVDDFTTLNAALTGFGAQANTVRVGNAQSGDYAAEMTPVNIGFGIAPGIVTNAELNPVTFEFNSGAAFSARPDSMTGWYKADLDGSDTCTITVEFYETGTLIDDTVLLITQSATSWTKFEFAFDLPVAPDTMLINCASGVQPGTVFTIDNFQLAGGDLGVAEGAGLEFAMYPNPAKNFVNISSGAKMDKINVYTLTGQLVNTMNVNGTLKMFNVANMEPGTYLMEVVAGEHTTTKTLIVE